MSITTTAVSVRLGQRIEWKPTRYHVKTLVHLDTWRFETTEIITLSRQGTAGSKSKTAVLHAAASLTDITVIDGSAQIVRRDADLSQIELELNVAADDCPVHTVTLTFSGSILEELRGFYRITTEGTAQEKRLAATHFEPTGARLFFICLDEPSERAEFVLEVSLPLALVQEAPLLKVLTNAPLERTATNEALQTVTHVFHPLPNIPPYLCALVVGELECITRVVRSTPVAFYTTPGRTNEAEFGLDAASYSLDLFTALFGCPYPLPKLDLVALPSFPIGGMENWGCICLVESCLLDPASASVQSCKSVSNLICHEVSHNWFGNLVGIDWWEGLWLKEGFASWCGYYATECWKPEWRVMDDAALDVDGAMNVDTFADSHPVEVPIADPAYITQVFDAISYDKGMAVVMMLRSYLGKDAFESGLHAYMKAYAFANTTTMQLWEVMERATGKPVAAMMSAFTKQVGYPVVHVTTAAAEVNSGASCCGSDVVVHLRQERCRTAAATATDAAAASSTASTSWVSSDLSAAPRWCIPVVYTEGVGPTARRATATLAESSASIPTSGQLPLKVNALQESFFRCTYEKSLRTSLYVSFAKLPHADRRGLVVDAFAALLTGVQTDEAVDGVVGVVRAVSQSGESDLAVLNAYFRCLRDLASQLDASGRPEDVSTATALLEEGLSFLMPKALEWTSRSPSSCTAEELQTRAIVIAQALRLLSRRRQKEDTSDSNLGAPESTLLEWAARTAEAFLSSDSAAPAEIEVMSAALATFATERPSPDVKQKLWDKYKAVASNANLCRLLLRAMCLVPDAPFVVECLSQCTANGSIRSQYGAVVFIAASDNGTLGRQLWGYFQAQFGPIVQQWGSGQFRIQAIVESVAKSLATVEEASEWDAFFLTHPIPNAALNIRRSSEAIRLRAFLSRSVAPPLLRRLLKSK